MYIYLRRIGDPRELGQGLQEREKDRERKRKREKERE